MNHNSMFGVLCYAGTSYCVPGNVSVVTDERSEVEGEKI